MARKRARREPAAPKPRPPRRWGIDRLELALIALALLVRLPHLGWGLPEVEEEALPMKQALTMWGWDSGHGTLDPGVAGWPSLSFYLQLTLQHLHYWVGRILGIFANRDDYFVAWWLNNASVLILARLSAALATVGIVWIAFRLARRLAGIEAALMVGGLLVLSPLLIEYSQLVTPDVWVALFSALAVARIVAIQQRGETSDYVWAGIWIGLGISSKYTPVLFLPAFFAAHVLRAPRPGASSIARRKLASFVAPQPWLGVLAAGAAFAVTSPFVLLNLPVLIRDVQHQTMHMTQGHFGVTNRPAAIEYLIGVLAPALGWAGLALSIAGLVWACVRFGGPWLAIAACIVPFYLGLSLLKTQFPRYVLPLLMPLAMGLAGLVAALREHAIVRPRLRFAAAALALVTLAPVAVSAWKYHVEKARPSATHLADAMFEKTPALQHAHIASEILALSLPTALTLDAFPAGLLARLTPEQQQRLKAKPVYDVEFIPMYAVQPEMSAFYYDLRHYVAYDYIVISESMRNRYRTDPERFATQLGFYRDLDHYARLVQSYGAAQNARPPDVFVYQMTPDSAAALLRARGPKPLDPALLATLAGNDFMVFVEGVARAAYARGDWRMAADYYRLLWQAGPRGGMAPEQRDALGRLISQIEAHAAGGAKSR
jgi:hypothetical protein